MRFLQYGPPRLIQALDKIDTTCERLQQAISRFTSKCYIRGFSLSSNTRISNPVSDYLNWREIIFANERKFIQKHPGDHICNLVLILLPLIDNFHKLADKKCAYQ